MSTITIGVIGAGRAGLIHARAFLSHVTDASLVGIADPSEKARTAASDELGIPTFEDHHQLLELADAAVIVAPTKFHRDIAVEAAHAGCHVLCEKPLAMTLQQCQEIIAAAAHNGVKLQVGFMRRFDSGFQRAKSMVDAGEIGEIVSIKSLTHGPSTPHPWMYDIGASNGPLAEVSSHDIDTIRWFTGSEVSSLYALAGNYRCPEARESHPDFYDSVIVNARMSNGSLALIDGAQGVRYGYDSRVEILGTHGRIDIGDLHADKVTLHRSDGLATRLTTASWRTLFHEAYIKEDQAFVHAILNDEEPSVTGTDGLAAVAVVNAGNESIRTGKVVTLPSHSPTTLPL